MGFLFRSGPQATPGNLTTDKVGANPASKTALSGTTVAAEESDRATARSDDKKRHKKSKKSKKHRKKDSSGKRRSAGKDGSSSTRGGRAGATADLPDDERENADNSRRIALVRLDVNTRVIDVAHEVSRWRCERLTTPLDDFHFLLQPRLHPPAFRAPCRFLGPSFFPRLFSPSMSEAFFPQPRDFNVSTQRRIRVYRSFFCHAPGGPSPPPASARRRRTGAPNTPPG